MKNECSNSGFESLHMREEVDVPYIYGGGVWQSIRSFQGWWNSTLYRAKSYKAFNGIQMQHENISYTPWTKYQ